MTDASAISDFGWRQGAVLPVGFPLAKAYNLCCNIDADHRAILISQDCDIVHPDLKVEPFVEFLLLKPLNTCDPGFADGKSARCFHLQTASTELSFEVKPWMKGVINRADLIGISPDFSISFDVHVIKTVVNWFGERYTRTSFPDNFVNRMRSAHEAIKKLLKNDSNLVWKLLISVQPRTELGDDDMYEVKFLCVVMDDVLKDPVKAKKVEVINQGICKSIKTKGKGVELVSGGVVSADEAPLSHLMIYSNWDVYSYMTHREVLKGD